MQQISPNLLSHIRKSFIPRHHEQRGVIFGNPSIRKVCKSGMIHRNSRIEMRESCHETMLNASCGQQSRFFRIFVFAHPPFRLCNGKSSAPIVVGAISALEIEGLYLYRDGLAPCVPVMRQLHYGHHLSQLQYLACLERCLRPGTASGRSDLMTILQIRRTRPRGPAWAHGDQARERIDKKCRNQKAGNDLRAFRWGTVADHPDLIYLHPTLSCAKSADE